MLKYIFQKTNPSKHCYIRSASFSGSTSLTPRSKSNVPEIPNSVRSGLEASYARGTGGRLSFSGNVITVFGATGFLGNDVLNALGRDGNQLIIPYRCEPYDIRSLKLCGDLGQVLFMPFYLPDEESIRKVVRHSNIVINMVGRNFHTSNFTMHDVNADGARRIARISKEMGVKRFIHFSALNANENPPEFYIPGGSRFIVSKGLGERYVRDEFPDATIVRPSIIYGTSDQIFDTYAHFFRKTYFDRWNLYKKGEETFKSPVSRRNVANGTLQLVRDPTSAGKIFEFCGPHWYNMGDLIDYIANIIHRDGEIFYGRDHHTFFSTLKANWFSVYQFFSKRQVLMNWESIETIECYSDLLTGHRTLEDLGIVFDVIEDQVPQLIAIYDKERHYKAKTFRDVVPTRYAKRYPPMYVEKHVPASERFQDSTTNSAFNFAV